MLSERVVWNIEVMFRHNPERTERGQGTTVFTVQLVYSVAVHDQFALVAARQVEVSPATIADGLVRYFRLSAQPRSNPT